MLVLAVLASAAVSFFVSYPLQKKVEALESMLEMLSRAVREMYTKER